MAAAGGGARSPSKRRALPHWWPCRGGVPPAFLVFFCGATALASAASSDPCPLPKVGRAARRFLARVGRKSYAYTQTGARVRNDPAPGAPAAAPAGAASTDDAIVPVARTCPDLLALDRRQCGDPSIDQCHCEKLGCCWGGDDPFTSTLTESGWHGMPPCYYLYGGYHQVSPSLWDAPMGEAYDLKVNTIPAADAGAVKFMIIAGDGVCGENSISDQVESAGEAPAANGEMGVLVKGVRINAEGEYKVCMNDAKDVESTDEDKYFTVLVGKINVFAKIAEVIGGCDH